MKQINNKREEILNFLSFDENDEIDFNKREEIIKFIEQIKKIEIPESIYNT